MLYSELRDKEVINLRDCTFIGFVSDIDFNCSMGCIESLIVPNCQRFLGIFGKCDDYVIPFKCVEKIGPDAILVDICPKGLASAK